jgi:hypothetical protein
LLLTEINSAIQMNLDGYSMKLERTVANIVLYNLRDLPNYDVISEYLVKANIVNSFRYSKFGYLSVMADSLLKKRFFDSNEKAIQFILATPELTKIYMSDWGGVIEGMKIDFHYQEQLLENALSEKDLVNKLDIFTVCRLGELFKDKPDLQEKILNIALQNGDLAKRCLHNKLDREEVFEAFPNHVEKLKKLEQSEQLKLRRL